MEIIPQNNHSNNLNNNNIFSIDPNINHKDLDNYYNNSILTINDNEAKSFLNSDIQLHPKNKKTTKMLIEEYYKYHFPQYKTFYFSGILFCKIGNLLSFNFNKELQNYSPKICIGPQWYLFLFLNISVIFLSIITYRNIFIYFNFWVKFIFFLFIFLIFFILSKVGLVNPGIVLNKTKTKTDYGYCPKCKIYFNPYNKVEHCEMCDSCIEGMDHHCIWMGTCIAKNNKKYFYGLIVAIFVFYIYVIIFFILVLIDKIGNKKKKSN